MLANNYATHARKIAVDQTGRWTSRTETANILAKHMLEKYSQGSLLRSSPGAGRECGQSWPSTAYLAVCVLANKVLLLNRASPLSATPASVSAFEFHHLHRMSAARNFAIVPRSPSDPAPLTCSMCRWPALAQIGPMFTKSSHAA